MVDLHPQTHVPVHRIGPKMSETQSRHLFRLGLVPVYHQPLE